jgi:SAM-dependent methyltransferase
MWWFAAVHANLLTLHQHLTQNPATPRPLLDAGCGTGGFLARIAHSIAEQQAMGIDADRFACTLAAAKSRRPVCAGSIDALPFADEAFAAIFSVDVLCHGGVDEERALAQLHRCLVADGLLLLNLPAYGWMMSAHDRAVYNVRRYTRRQVLALLRAAGFRPLFATYWNMLLFPIMVMTRKLLSAGPDAGSDVELPSPVVDTIGRVATAIERAVLRAGIRLPFGGSIIAVAAKTESCSG